MDDASRSPPDQHAGNARPRWRYWTTGALLSAALIGAVFHWGELQRFAALAEAAKPEWMGLAVALQLSTYAFVAAGWREVLSKAGSPLALGSLMKIAVTKLFADQMLPSAGIGGNIVLIDQLRSRGTARGTAMATLLLSMIGFYAAYAVFAVAMLAMLWLHERATALISGVVTLFIAVAVAIPTLALWLRKRGSEPLPAWIEGVGFIRRLVESVAEAPGVLLADHRLLAKVAMWNASIFLADAATLYACLRAVGEDPSAATAFIALIMASIVATLGPIPLGLGSFEATATATLHLLGIRVEAAFAATMLLRLLTLWLPLLPGMILLRNGLGRADRHDRSKGG